MRRIDYTQLSPDLTKKLFDLSQASAKTDLDPMLQGLVKIRASQINGCAFCLDMHVKEAKIQGEKELRLYHVSVWKESPLFSEKEKAALEWTEALTTLSGHAVPQETYERLRKQLTNKELSDLTFSIVVINAWNRLNIGSPARPGSMDEIFGLTKAGL